MKWLLIIFPLWIQAQPINIAYLGDSHCNGGFGLLDSNWINRTNKFFTDRGRTVSSYKFCTGGETIKTNMPLWFPGSVAGKSVDNALAVNPDIIFFLQSGNHIANGIPLDSTKRYYKYIGDTLQTLGRRFMFSTSGPRQNTFAVGMDIAKYAAQADSLDNWLYATFPNNVFNIWDTLTDKSDNKPYAYLLRVDSLHYLAEGHRRLWQMTLRDSKQVDTLTGYDKIKGYNLSFTTTAINFGSVDLKYVYIYGSNDGVTFDLIKYIEFLRNSTIPVSGYSYVKVVAQNNTRTVTVTKHFL